MHSVLALLKGKWVIIHKTWCLWTQQPPPRLAPPAVAPCDNGPICYAHAIMNYMPIWFEEDWKLSDAILEGQNLCRFLWTLETIEGVTYAKFSPISCRNNWLKFKYHRAKKWHNCKPSRIWICCFVKRWGMTNGAIMQSFKNLPCIKMKIQIYNCFHSLKIVD
jgi:hypothetical protein